MLSYSTVRNNAPALARSSWAQLPASGPPAVATPLPTRRAPASGHGKQEARPDTAGTGLHVRKAYG